MFAQERYKIKYNIGTYNYNRANQYNEIKPYGSQYDQIYTALVIDLMDTRNQRNSGSMYPNDRVSGYTITQIQRALREYHSWGQWKNRMYDLYDNPTKIYLEELYSNWH